MREMILRFLILGAKSTVKVKLGQLSKEMSTVQSYNLSQHTIRLPCLPLSLSPPSLSPLLLSPRRFFIVVFFLPIR